MSQVITDKTFNEETDKGLVLIDFGQLGVVHVVCKHRFWISWNKNMMKKNSELLKWMWMKIQKLLNNSVS